MQLHYVSKYAQEDFLEHHGIKGQRWGVRRYQPYTKGNKVSGGKEVGKAAKKSKRAEDYTSKQRSYDRKMYGRGAERRINKRMLNGEGIRSARHNEVVRKDKTQKIKNVGKKISIATVGIGGTIAVTAWLKKRGINNAAVGEVSKAIVDIGKAAVRAMF